MKPTAPANINIPTIPLAEGLPVETPQEIGLSQALQSVYDDIFLIDFEKDTCHELHHGGGHFAPVPSGKSLSETLQQELVERVHPDDAQRFLALFTPSGLNQRRPQTPTFAAEDLRKKCIDGTYRWVRIIAFPAPQFGSEYSYIVCTEDVENHKFAANIAHENEILRRQKLDALRYKAVVDHTRTLVFGFFRVFRG